MIWPPAATPPELRPRPFGLGLRRGSLHDLAHARAHPAIRRIMSIDIVRGAVIVLMALDHVRDWTTNVRVQPEDLSRTTMALFATRWVYGRLQCL
jgi:uncharacterized membrane protein